MALSVSWLIILQCLFFIQVCSGQIAVTVTAEAGEGFVGYTKVLTCRYAWIPPCPKNPDGTVCTLAGILWRKVPYSIGYLDHEDGDYVEYYGEYNEPNYVISSTNISTGCDLTIQSVAQTDAGNYECKLFTDNHGTAQDEGQTVLTVRTLVPPTTISLDYNGMTYNDGCSISVVAGVGKQFTCKTPGVYPQTTFTWTLPSCITTDQPLGTTTSSTNTDGTVDSSNTITVSIPENPATSQLTCGATNRPDGSTQPDISITVTLQIKAIMEDNTREDDTLTDEDEEAVLPHESAASAFLHEPAASASSSLKEPVCPPVSSKQHQHTVMQLERERLELDRERLQLDKEHLQVFTQISGSLREISENFKVFLSEFSRNVIRIRVEFSPDF